ncbi:hypothetical protein BDF14DRAFT_1886991 [Spinellus fusiger]|nr:hypothetical protein BDF14DRAFT_1886991 [Spinellus fusiger]
MTDTEEFDSVHWDVQGVEMNNSHHQYQTPYTLEGSLPDSLHSNLDVDPLESSLKTLSTTPDHNAFYSIKENLATLTPHSIDITEDPLLDSRPATLHTTEAGSSYDQIQSISEVMDKKRVSLQQVLVTDPRKENDYQQGTFVSYGIVSGKQLVRRRFQDFVWLRNVLYAHYPACFVPPLPDKHRMGYVKGDRFGAGFIEKRRMSLQRFLQRIAWHPILGKAQFFTMFLESNEFNDVSARTLRESQETMIDTLGDSLLNAFSKLKKPEERFVEMKERIERMEENLDLLEKTLLRSHKRTEDLHSDYEEFATSIRGLGELETTMKPTLDQFASSVNQYAHNIKAMTASDGDWLGEIHDYMAYYSVLKGVLKLRDQKQLDVEELTEYIHSTMKEREKLINPRLGDNSYNLTGYFTGKINEVRGADTDKMKREKVMRLDERLSELKEAKKQAHEVSFAFSDQVKKEDTFFTQSKSIEMHEALKKYTTGKVEFYQQGAQIWRDVVLALERLDPDEA